MYQPLGNQPLELSAFKELPSGDAHRKVEEGKERSSPALLGAAEEVSPTGEHGCSDTVQCNVTGALVRASELCRGATLPMANGHGGCNTYFGSKT